MDSVIGPLVKKVEFFNKDIFRVREGLVAGDPQSVKDIHTLTSNISKLYQDCKAAFNQLSANFQTAVKTFMIIPGGSVTISSLTYWAGEAFNAISLMIAVIKLITNLVSINTLLQLAMTQLTKAYGYLNIPVIWLNKSIERTKQKLAKKLEWQRRTIAATLNVAYLKGQKKQYNAVLTQLKAKLPPKPPPQEWINGIYVNGTFVYSNNPLNSNLVNATKPGASKPGTSNTTMSSNAQNAAVKAAGSSTVDTKITESVISNVETRLAEITIQLTKEELELKSGIKNDQKYWNDKWIKEEKEDKKLLQSIKKKLPV